LTLAIILLVVGFCLVMLEVFIPSGGMLTVLALVSVGISIYFAFAESVGVGALFLVIAVVGMPLVAYEMLKLFPKTQIGRRFLLFGPRGHEEVATSSELKLRNYEGKRGVTKTKLRPTGVADIEGERVDVVSEGMIIDSGKAIEVIDVTGNRVVVREIEEETDGRGKGAAT
jgi:membrane-bound serine protease (ClpP class)